MTSNVNSLLIAARMDIGRISAVFSGIKSLDSERLKGQAPMILTMLFLLLVPTSIIAYNATTSSPDLEGYAIIDGENLTEISTDVSVSVSDEAVSDQPGAAIPEAEVETAEGGITQENSEQDSIVQANESSQIPETAPDEEVIEVTDDVAVTEQNQENASTSEQSSEMNQTETDSDASNESQNVTMPGDIIGDDTDSEGDINISVNVTIPGEIVDNATNLTEQNMSEVQDSDPEIVSLPPVIDVVLEAPGKVIRGQDLILTSRITNNGYGPAQNLVLEWTLPEGFALSSGSTFRNCGTLEPGETCNSEIGIGTAMDLALGENQVRVSVRYE